MSIRCYLINSLQCWRVLFSSSCVCYCLFRSCSACPAGFSCTLSSITPCPDGSYCTGGSASPIACPPNFRCTRSQSIPCPAGTYSPAQSTKCLPCPAGSQCPSSAGGASSCSAGEWSSVGATACQDCPVGYHCPTSSKPPIRCPIGTHSSSVKAQTCTQCPAGSQCSNPTIAPSLCSEGYFSEAGASYCTLCPAGSKCTGGVKTACSSSTYALSGQSSCSNCQSGYFCSLTAHYKCPPGTYEQSRSCVAVPDGNYSADQITLSSCTAGTYTNADKTGCIACPEGHVCSGGANSPSACSSGEYVNGNTCTTCSSTQTCRHPNLSPSSCTDGYYLSSSGTFCAMCPRGSFCTNGVKANCLSGQYSFEAASSCFSLSKVSFTNTLYPISAPYGFYKDPSSGEITQCPENKYCPSPMHQPIDCPAGWWSPAGLWTCIPNAPGGTAPYAFATSSITAPKNYEMGSDFLFPCPMGTYADAGAGKCTMIESSKGWDLATQSTTTCSAGYYSPPGEAFCKPVPAGFSYSGSGDPTICSGGQFSPSGSSSCSDCPSGTWSESGASVCLPCPAGYKCQNQDSLTLCLKGQYSLQNMPTCQACAPGFICYPGSDTPTPVQFLCPKGYFCPVSGSAVVQTPCPAGYYGTMEGATSQSEGCYECPAGFLCPSAAQDYIWYPCPPHHYCTRGATSATSCPTHTYFPGLRARAEHECEHDPEGYFLVSNVPNICPIGHYCPGKDTKQVCPDGTYNLDQGAISINSCLACPPGHFCTGGAITGAASVLRYMPYYGAAQANEYRVPPGSGNTDTANSLYYLLKEDANKVAEIGMAAQLCEHGLLSGFNGISQEACVRCRLGMQCSDGLTEKTCPQGKYCSQTNQNYTADCPRGTYGASAGLKHVDECTPCPSGKYCSGGGTSTENCPTGFYCPASTIYPIRCPDGYYGASVDLAHLSDCTICDADYYCRDGFKTKCPVGTYQPAKGEAECLPCPGGYKCDDGSGNKVRELCPKGQYSAPGDPEGCVNCPRGYACNRRGISMVDLSLYRCQNGYSCNTSGTQDAVLLAVYGQYSLAGIIYNCPEGFYHLKYGATSLADCKRIPAGFYSTISAFTSSGQLLLCPVGHYCPEGTHTPVPCPKRTFNPVTMAKNVTECFECLAGFYCPNEGMNTYNACPQGKYCPDGTDKPELCPSGTYDGTGKLKSSAECTLCPPGKFCPDRGMTSVPDSNKCYAGFYCDRGSPQPDPISKVYGDICPAGSYCPEGASSPQACDAGFYNPNPGAKSSSDCAPCTPGFYCLGDNSASPTGPCKGGYYCPAGSSSETAQPAAIGHYAPQGSPIQIPCPPGTYASNTEQAACTNCEKGKYCPNQGMTATLPCPVGFYCPSKEQQDNNELTYNKIPCEPGTYRDTEGAEAVGDCAPCPPGKACPFYGMTAGTTYTCKAGFFCKTRATSANPAIADSSDNFGPCPVGHYCPQETSTPQACAAGSFLPYEGARAASECIPCNPGMYCETSGLSEPTGICRAGYFCPQSSTSQTANQCPVKKYCPRGSGAALDCPSGMYQDEVGKYNCKVCTAGNYCEGGLQIECKTGTYCPGN